jgi:angio-associated migratory cell protein
MKLKCIIEEGPDTKDDMNFITWHPKGNVFLTGGKDNLIWLLNGANGNFIGCLAGHKAEVLMASFTNADGGKLVVSSSVDLTLRVWSPRKA